ncbi:MAG: NifB/NifX family molybdenum-iron cluster-binding protein [Candidatus Acetothermia bacterium]|nr:NifB/NifX family molybdenum-iron cluster-binding protein [Candidatus Bipolaricaulota bacterium]
MKIAVTSLGEDLSSGIDGRFGRCDYFVIVDPETLDYEAIPNQSKNAIGGAGPAAAQTVAGSGVTAILTGNVGPNAYRALSSAGIEIYTGSSGTVKDAVRDFNEGNLSKTEGSTTPGGGGKRRR